jgi:serine/threonine-protein kinase RsbW
MSSSPRTHGGSARQAESGGNARAPDIRIELVSDPTYLSGARELVSAVARRLGFSDEAAGQVALALDEALCNVIRHGYDRRRDGLIWISIWPLAAPDGRGTGLRIVVEDEARAVDPATIRSRDLEDIRPGGLGVHIIREVMDEVIYEQRPTVGMKLTLVKWQPDAAACRCNHGGCTQGGA